MNSITVAGALGKDAEVRAMPNGDPVASFSVADSQGREKPSIWWSCQIFGKRAQALAPYLLKGQQVTVVGSVTEREWIDKDGGKRKSMDVRVQEIALQGGRKDSADAPPARQAAPSRQAPVSASTESRFADMDDDIPFVSASMHYDMTTSKARKMARYDY